MLLPGRFRGSLFRRTDAEQYSCRSDGRQIAARGAFDAPTQRIQIDNALDRTAYLDICWPNSAITRFEEIYQAQTRDRVFIVHEGHAWTGKRFRNCELHTVRDGKLFDTETAKFLGRTSSSALSDLGKRVEFLDFP